MACALWDWRWWRTRVYHVCSRVGHFSDDLFKQILFGACGIESNTFYSLPRLLTACYGILSLKIQFASVSMSICQQCRALWYWSPTKFTHRLRLYRRRTLTCEMFFYTTRTYLTSTQIKPGCIPIHSCPYFSFCDCCYLRVANMCQVLLLSFSPLRCFSLFAGLVCCHYHFSFIADLNVHLICLEIPF